MTRKPTYKELEQRVKELKKLYAERKQVEDALNENQKLLNSIIESTADGILVGDRDGTFSYANSRFAEMWHIPNEVMGTKERHKLHEVVSEQLKGSTAFFTRLKELYQSKGEFIDIVEFKDGRIFERFSTPLIKDSVVSGRVWSFRDITERKQAEEALRESEEKYRNLSEGTFEAVVWHNKGKIIEANEQYYEMFGYKPEELAGKDAISLTATTDSVKFMRKQIFKDHVGPYEVVGVKKDGTEFPMEIRVKMMKYKGKVARMAAIRDLADRKQIEEELRKARDDLERRVMERTKELNIKTKDLEGLNAALRVLLDKREEDKTRFQDSIVSNVKTLIEPYVHKLKRLGLPHGQKTLLNILESNLNEIVSPFAIKLTSKLLNLSHSEIRVANLVKHGKTSKEIAEVLDVTERTIEFHRGSIRKKLGIKNQKTNLKTYLMSLD